MRLFTYIATFTIALLCGMTFIDSAVEFIAAVLLYSSVTTLLVYPAERARQQDDAYNVHRLLEAERRAREVHLGQPRDRYSVFHDGLAD